VVQVRVTPKTRNPFTIKALSISAAAWKWHVLNHADYRGIVDPAAIGAILEMPAFEAKRLLELYQWREGDVALLEAVAAKLGLKVPDAR
jgi:hypothetical protein